MELSDTHISIDILNAAIFLFAFWRALLCLYFNGINLREKIFVVAFLVAAGLYVFQTSLSVLSGTTAPSFIWDIINGIYAFLAISIIQFIIKERTK